MRLKNTSKPMNMKVKRQAISPAHPLTQVRQRRTMMQVGHMVETRPFQVHVEELLDYDGFADIQDLLRNRPDAGSVLSGTGGCRKLRWEALGKGKRGGVRVIYYWYQDEGEIFLLLIYSKGEKDSLSQEEKKELRKLIKGR